MTWPMALAASCLRSTLLMLMGLIVARTLETWHRGTPSSTHRRLHLALLMVAFLTPNLVVGFGYRAVSVNLLNHRWLNELLYFALLAFELTPAAAWLLLASPPPALSAEAWHCARLAQRGDRAIARFGSRLRLWWQGSGRTLAGPAALLFVLSFQESELAALMQVAGWPERLFTDHVKGVPPATTLRLVALPAMVQLPSLIPLWSALRSAAQLSPVSALAEQRHRPVTNGAVGISLRIFAWCWAIAGVGFVLGEPLWILLEGLWKSSRTVVLQPNWKREIGHALLLAATCASLAWGMAWLVRASPRDRQRGWNMLISLSVLPGLIGTLALGLLTAGFFQQALPGLAYSPLPLILAECLWLWPRALVIRESLVARTRGPAHHIALLARSPDVRQRDHAGRLWWRLSGVPQAGGLLLVFWWSYLEVMLPTILAMPGFQPAPQVMYNHLHFGQLEALGVKLAMILATPLFLAMFLLLMLRRARWPAPV
jgi:hypothetical protein